jgi:hypothetical protein
MASAPAFFSPWEAPPAFAAPPADAQLAERVSALVRYAVQNGPGFIQVVQAKQQDNPEYAFLRPGGAGHHYYRWALHCAVHNQPAGAAPPAAHPPAAAAAAAAAAAPAPYSLPADLHAGFEQLLAGLTGSKESIKGGQARFMGATGHAQGLALLMAERCALQLSEQDKQLHVIYLANDILFKSLATRQAGAEFSADPVAMAFHPVLASMVAAVFCSSGRAAATRAKLSKILKYWEERRVRVGRWRRGGAPGGAGGAGGCWGCCRLGRQQRAPPRGAVHAAALARHRRPGPGPGSAAC